jgi:hypothetical protein
MAADPSDAYTRCRKLLNSIDFQLQQLDEQDAAAAAAAAGAGMAGSRAAAGGAGAAAAAASSLADDDSMRRHAITENLNRLTAEVAALERAVAEAYDGVAAASAKSDIWRK